MSERLISGGEEEVENPPGLGELTIDQTDNVDHGHKLFVEPRAAFSRTYRMLKGMKVQDIVQRMVDTGKVLWVGQELKWVGRVDGELLETEGNGYGGVGLEEEGLISDGEGSLEIEVKFKQENEDLDEEEMLEGIQEMKLRRNGRRRIMSQFGNGFMVEPPHGLSKKITRLRDELEKAYEDDQDCIEKWEKIKGTDAKSLAARKKIHQEWFNRQLKKVDPSSIVPVSVSGSTASSASSGSEDDPECIATDEEDEAEMITGSIEGWILPRGMTSRSPSPVVVAEPEFELDEPEFILTEPVPEEPPAKKRKQKHEPQPHTDGKIYPKPAFSYSCLIAMALKNSKTGCLPVSEIYKFMCDHFPYFKSAPSGWKNSVRHNLSLNKCFEKIEKPGTGARKGCLWALNPAKVTKMDEEVQKWSRKDPLAIRRAMSDPENLELIEKGELKRDYSGNAGSDEDEEEDFSEPATPATPAQIARRNRPSSSSDSIIAINESRVSGTASQIRTAFRPTDHRTIHLKDDTLDFGTITNVQGNYLCHSTNNGTNTYTLSFSSIHNSPTPLIIRRTPVK